VFWCSVECKLLIRILPQRKPNFTRSTQSEFWVILPLLHRKHGGILLSVVFRAIRVRMIIELIIIYVSGDTNLGLRKVLSLW